MKKRLILCMAGLGLAIGLCAQTATNLQVLDTRDENPGPVSYSHEVKFEFKNRISMGIPGAGAWSGMMTLAPWFSGDNSGNKHHQLNFNDGGIFYRTGLPASLTWESWRKLILADANDNLMIPGVYNFEQVKLGQYGNGKCGLELVNHSGLNSSYGVRFYSSGDGENGNIGMYGLQIQTAFPSDTYEGLSYATRLAIGINGNVGIGTSTPNAQLEINSSTNDRGLIVGAIGKNTKIYLHVSNGDYVI